MRLFETARCIGHSGPITGYKVVAAGTKLASFSRRLDWSHGCPFPSMIGDASAIVWELPTGKRLLTLQHAHLYDCLFSDDGRYIASHDPYAVEGLRVWDLADGGELATFRSALEDAQRLVAICPKGKCLITTRLTEGTLAVWGLPNAGFRFSIQGGCEWGTNAPVGAISRDGSLFAYVRENKTQVDVWGLSEQQLLGTVHLDADGSSSSWRSVWFTHDGSRLFVSVEGRPTRRLGAIDTSDERLVIFQIARCGPAASFDPIDNAIIQAVGQHRAEILDAESAEKVGAIEGPQCLDSAEDCPDGLLPARDGVRLSPSSGLLLLGGNLTASVWARET